MAIVKKNPQEFIVKHSIAKYVVATIVIATIAMAGVIAYLEIREARAEAYREAETVTYSASRAMALGYSGYEGREIFSDERITETLEFDLKLLVDETDLLFAYVVEVDADSMTLNYHFIDGADKVASTVNDVKNNSIQKRDSFSDELKRVMSGESRKEDIEVDNQFGHVISTYVPITNTDDEIIAVAGADKDVADITQEALKIIPFRVAAVFLIGAIGIIVALIVMRRKVILPVKKISEAMQSFGKSDNLEITSLNIDTKDEFGLISHSFNNMAREIATGVEQIKHYARSEAEQASELKTAANIQTGFLPKSHFENENVEIWAKMNPAKEVGGDFYDYFEVDGKMVVVIGDVSGKGLSGAMFMASAIGLIRAFAKSGLEPHEVLSRVNKELETTNPNMMFVTVFLAYIDTKNLKVKYSNAGHNPPYLVLDESVMTIEDASSMPIGIFVDEKYTSKELTFPLGSTLFLFTDGVNEAKSEGGEFFGNERLEQLLNQSNSQDITQDVLSAVKAFSAGAKQFDDITMLATKIRSDELILSAKKENFATLKSWILSDDKLSGATKKDVCLIAEEMLHRTVMRILLGR